ncbi:MAG: hypothetical protein A4E19_00530 [Nitrospira sp. SG-bin1]|nr:MAG: hypothetical protein A4E19_00530 [Nitrospira sp. SG-bin1]
MDSRQRQANAEISRETDELLKGYRQCIQKHEGDLAKAKESCALYREGLERIQLRSCRVHVCEATAQGRQHTKAAALR